MNLLWKRSYPESMNNFDLVLENPEALDTELAKKCLDDISREKHREVTLKKRARDELLAWIDDPTKPLKSEAYALLSNWFLTNSGDRQSSVALYCERLWDLLFNVRPDRRLTSPEPGRNHIILPSEFQSFFRKLRPHIFEVPDVDLTEEVDVQPVQERNVVVDDHVSGNGLRAVFQTGRMKVELEGSASEIAEFFRKVDGR